MRQFIRLPRTLQRSTVSKATLYRWMQKGMFPRQYPLDDNGRIVGWLEDEVEEWVEQRIAARKAGMSREQVTESESKPGAQVQASTRDEKKRKRGRKPGSPG